MRRGDIHYLRWRALAIWITAFTIVTIWLIINSRNQSFERANDINKARIASCKQGRVDLQNLLNLATVKARKTFTQKQEDQYDKLLNRFSPKRCK